MSHILTKVTLNFSSRWVIYNAFEYQPVIISNVTVFTQLINKLVQRLYMVRQSTIRSEIYVRVEVKKDQPHLANCKSESKWVLRRQKESTWVPSSLSMTHTICFQSHFLSSFLNWEFWGLANWRQSVVVLARQKLRHLNLSHLWQKRLSFRGTSH
jgi:hypothetical protein